MICLCRLLFDIVDFYPSILDELLTKSIEWSKKHTSIDNQEYETIMLSRRTLLHDNKGNIWTKKEIKKQFDVSMVVFDGAEVCELIGLCIISTFNESIKFESIGLHRDNGLAVLYDMPRTWVRVLASVNFFIYSVASFLLCCPCEVLEGPNSTSVGII